MKKKISKIFYSILIVIIMFIQVIPSFTYAGNYNSVKTATDKLGKLLGPNWLQEWTNTYPGSETSVYDVEFATDRLNGSDYSSWMDNMIMLATNAIGKNIIDTSGVSAQKIASSATSENQSTRVEYLEKAVKAMNTLRNDIVTMADLETYIPSDLDVYIGTKKWEDIPVLNWVWDGKINVNKEQQTKIFQFRQKLIDTFGANGLGSVYKYILSAEYTYKAALAMLKGGYTEPGFNLTGSEKRKFTKEQIDSYFKTYGYNFKDSSNEEKGLVEAKWASTLGLDEQYADISGVSGKVQQYVIDLLKDQTLTSTRFTEEQLNEKDANTQDEKPPKEDKDKDTVFQQPKNVTAVAQRGADDVINDADKFIDDGKDVNEYISTEELKDFSQTLYSILFGLGIIIAVVVGVIIGIRLMFAPVGQKAEAKKLLIPYAVGCIVVFAAFGIWQLVVTILQGV